MMNDNTRNAVLALGGFLFLAATADAATVEESGVASEVNNCIAEVRENLDYSNADRIRHEVTAIERRTVGYTLNIETSLFDENGESPVRAYAATCIVNGDNPPLSFTIARAE
jgi:hypothetical protein